MSNHDIPCDFCGEDTRGLGGVKGCRTLECAKNCSHYRGMKEKEKAEVVSLAERTGNGAHWGVKEMLQYMLKCIEEDPEGEYKGFKKGLVILLDDSKPGVYDTTFVAADLLASEVVSLTEVLKVDMMRYMGRIPEVGD